MGLIQSVTSVQNVEYSIKDCIQNSTYACIGT